MRVISSRTCRPPATRRRRPSGAYTTVSAMLSRRALPPRRFAAAPSRSSLAMNSFPSTSSSMRVRKPPRHRRLAVAVRSSALLSAGVRRPTILMKLPAQPALRPWSPTMQAPCALWSRARGSSSAVTCCRRLAWSRATGAVSSRPPAATSGASYGFCAVAARWPAASTSCGVWQAGHPVPPTPRFRCFRS